MSADIERFLNMPDSLWRNIYWHHNSLDSREFRGQVLYLGMGSCFLPRHQSDAVTQTVIVELNPVVVEHNRKTNNLDTNWTIVIADAYQYTPDGQFDIIVADIWYDVQCESVINQLIDRYKPWLAPAGQIVNLRTVVRPGC